MMNYETKIWIRQDVLISKIINYVIWISQSTEKKSFKGTPVRLYGLFGTDFRSNYFSQRKSENTNGFPVHSSLRFQKFITFGLIVITIQFNCTCKETAVSPFHQQQYLIRTLKPLHWAFLPIWLCSVGCPGRVARLLDGQLCFWFFKIVAYLLCTAASPQGLSLHTIVWYIFSRVWVATCKLYKLSTIKRLGQIRIGQLTLHRKKIGTEFFLWSAWYESKIEFGLINWLAFI